MSDVAHAYVDTDPDGKTIVRANTESHSGHTLIPALVSRRTVIRLADQLGLIILDPELIPPPARPSPQCPASARLWPRALQRGVVVLRGQGVPGRLAGPASDYLVQVADVEPGSSIRAANGEVWADVDLILSNGAAQPALFHASAQNDAWEWSAR